MERSAEAPEKQVKASRLWKHEKSGRIYEVVLFANDKSESNLGLQVVYRRLHGEPGQFFSRPINAFLDKFYPLFDTGG